MRNSYILRKRFRTGDAFVSDDPRTGKEKAEAFRIQYLAGGHVVKTIEHDPTHDVEVEVY